MATTSNTLSPTTQEVRWWLLQVTQHTCRVEYFLNQFGLGSHDPERPHDIVGDGNKFEWEVIRGFAVQLRDKSPEFFDAYVAPSLRRHRCQYHHRCWNEPNGKATPDDMRVGAVDAICSLLENRGYQGGAHSFNQVRNIVRVQQDPSHGRPWMNEMLPKMWMLPLPRFERIVSLDNIPNVGIPKDTHDIVRQRVEETKMYLKADFGYQI